MTEKWIPNSVEKNYSRLDIACSQLESAIGLFVSGRDKFSAITLAGAADEIFVEFIRRAGKRDFSSNVQVMAEIHGKGSRKLSTLRSHINDTLKINAMKHFDQNDHEEILLNADECAVGAILRAIADLKLIVDQEPAYVSGMLAWCYLNFDSDKLLANYDKMPNRVKEFDAKNMAKPAKE